MLPHPLPSIKKLKILPRLLPSIKKLKILPRLLPSITKLKILSHPKTRAMPRWIFKCTCRQGDKKKVKKQMWRRPSYSVALAQQASHGASLMYPTGKVVFRDLMTHLLASALRSRRTQKMRGRASHDRKNICVHHPGVPRNCAVGCATSRHGGKMCV